MLVRLLLLTFSLAFGAAAQAQTGHPAKGSWSGDLTADGAAPIHMLMLLNTHNGDVSGTINPGKNGVTMDKVQLDPSTWTMTINAPMKEGALVLTGKLSNLGSWTNRKYSGTYTLGSRKGKFEFRLN